RHFTAAYITPTLAALAPALGDAPVRLHVSPELGELVPRLARPMSPAEKAIRTWYGEHVEPVLRWLPNRGMRLVWTVRRTVAPVTSTLDLFKVPREADDRARIELGT